MPFLLFFVFKFLLANLTIFDFWSIFGLILLGKSQKGQNEWQPTTTDVTRKRKRVKLKWLVCGRAFDDDHRKDHNERFHPEYKRENRLVPFEKLGVAIGNQHTICNLL